MNVTNNFPLFISPGTFASTMGVSPSTVYAHIFHGNLDTVRMGSRLRIRSSEIERVSKEGLPKLTIEDWAAWENRKKPSKFAKKKREL